MKDWINERKFHFITSIIIISVFYFTLILNGRYYVDDFGRSISGYSAWIINGRPMAEVFMRFINFGMPLTDISPLPQVIGIAFLSIAFGVLGFKIMPKSPVLISIVLSPIALSPTFIANMAYKYDAATMCLSVLVAIVASCTTFKSKLISFISCTFICIFFLSTYQPALNIYVIISILLLCIGNGESKRVLSEFYIKIFSLLSGMMLYKAIVAKITLSDDYNIKGSETYQIDNIIHGMQRNFRMYSNIIDSSISSPVQYLMWIIVFFSFIFLLKKALKLEKKSIHDYIYAFALLFSPLAVCFMIYGPLLILKNPVVHPRVLMGFGAAISFFLVLFLISTYKNICIALSSLLILYFSGICYSFVNIQTSQDKYEEYLSRKIVDDLSKVSEKVDAITIIGSAGYTPEARLNMIKYPFLKYLMRILINNNDKWGEVQLRHYDIKERYAKDGEREIAISSYCKSSIINTHLDYNFYIYNKIAIIDFDKKCN
ncbi:glucosyltransferase domain-containing protein [Hafnia alvei]|uniref:glucosyltransferase domain-containing protein n=1 Tax=Hafnia alvei TaxID=569 RepID=UPI0010340CA6|nr:glucosyltransferase domain-containing protein [Hafnia alvei]TBM16697.1 hypothetical protein EYY84_06275 [Hafnia alvei]